MSSAGDVTRWSLLLLRIPLGGRTPLCLGGAFRRFTDRGDRLRLLAPALEQRLVALLVGLAAELGELGEELSGEAGFDQQAAVVAPPRGKAFLVGGDGGPQELLRAHVVGDKFAVRPPTEGRHAAHLRDALQCRELGVAGVDLCVHHAPLERPVDGLLPADGLDGLEEGGRLGIVVGQLVDRVRERDDQCLDHCLLAAALGLAVGDRGGAGGLLGSHGYSCASRAVWAKCPSGGSNVVYEPTK